MKSILTASFSARIPLATADTNVWAYWSLGAEAPTLTSNVSVDLLDIVNHFRLEGSVDLGYLCSVTLLSLVHVKVIDSSLIKILCPLVNPWPAIVNTNLPLAGV